LQARVEAWSGPWPPEPAWEGFGWHALHGLAVRPHQIDDHQAIEGPVRRPALRISLVQGGGCGRRVRASCSSTGSGVSLAGLSSGRATTTASVRRCRSSSSRGDPAIMAGARWPRPGKDGLRCRRATGGTPRWSCTPRASSRLPGVGAPLQRQVVGLRRCRPGLPGEGTLSSSAGARAAVPVAWAGAVTARANAPKHPAPDLGESLPSSRDPPAGITTKPNRPHRRG